MKLPGSNKRKVKVVEYIKYICGVSGWKWGPLMAGKWFPKVITLPLFLVWTRVGCPLQSLRFSLEGLGYRETSLVCPVECLSLLYSPKACSLPRAAATIHLHLLGGALAPADDTGQPGRGTPPGGGPHNSTQSHCRYAAGCGKATLAQAPVPGPVVKMARETGIIKMKRRSWHGGPLLELKLDTQW